MKIIINFIIFFFITTNLFAGNFTLKKIVNLNDPWGSTFISDKEILITEKSGIIKLINLENKLTKIINHNLNVLEYGQVPLLSHCSVGLVC